MELVPSTDKDEGFEDEFSGNHATANNGHHPSEPHAQEKLGLWQGTALLTADCLGVGILVLPNSIHILGWIPGLAFLVLQLPINYYAGYILAWTARQVELEYYDPTRPRTTTNLENEQEEDPLKLTLEMAPIDPTSSNATTDDDSSLKRVPSTHSDSDQPAGPNHLGTDSGDSHETHHALDQSSSLRQDGLFRDLGVGDSLSLHAQSSGNSLSLNQQEQEDAPTQDLIGITTFVYDQHHLQDFWNGDSLTGRRSSQKQPNTTNQSTAVTARSIVMLLYYLNLFLVLGDYILVMAHAVAAIWPMCITTAGLLASTLMFAICQLNTMALLGRYVSIASLLAMVVVLGQCIFAAQLGLHDTANTSHGTNSTINDLSSAYTGVDEPPRSLLLTDLAAFSRSLATGQATTSEEDDTSLLRKFSALASICFAVGSQKLFLNVRYELKDRNHAAPVLARSLALFGMAYIVVVVLAGPNPPSFLFDAIPEGTLNRKIAGLLLWGHVAVSYAINSQALCSSLDRLVFSTASSSTDRARWIFLTLFFSIASYLVANGIPFFKDLVALIGAATSVPLTLTLPPVLYQHWQRWVRLRRRLAMDNQEDDEALERSMPSNASTHRDWDSIGTSTLLLYSVLFLGIGLAGAIASVKRDWAGSTSGPFACRHSG